MRPHRPWLAVVLVGAIIGLVFAGISTYDFVQHLDRQVHNLHCSFLPGVSQGGESGCQVAMMSPYSSVLRSTVWGGIPISLPAMAVFAFLVFYALDLAVTRRKRDPRATGFLALATALPAATSLGMLVISLVELGTTCKLCIAVYVASAVCLLGGIALWRGAVRDAPAGATEDRGVRRRDHHHDEPAFIGTARSDPGARLVAVGVDTGAVSTGFLAGMFAIGVAFVAIPVALYLAMAPDHARFIGTCEGLPHPEDSYGVMVRMERAQARGVPAIEVLDPLCPACRAFEQRLAASGLGGRIDRKAVLFPLDNTCNWMVTEATHPGACTVSEAVLCAGDKAPEVIAWAFETQDRIRSETRSDPAAAARIVKQRFPELASCVGSPDARSRLNKSMRWIVANNIRVLTPQLYIDRVKLCDEDVDLGLEYTLSSMLERHARGTLALSPLEKAPDSAAPASAPPGSAMPDPAADRPPGSEPPSKAGSDGAAPGQTASDRPPGTATPDEAAPGKAPPGDTEGAAQDRAADAPRGKPAPGTAAPDKASTDRPAATPDKAAPDKAAVDRPAATPDRAPPDRPAAAPDRAPPDKAPSDPAPPDPAPPDRATEKPSDISKAPDGSASGPVTRPGEAP